MDQSVINSSISTATLPASQGSNTPDRPQIKYDNYDKTLEEALLQLAVLDKNKKIQTPILREKTDEWDSFFASDTITPPTKSNEPTASLTPKLPQASHDAAKRILETMPLYTKPATIGDRKTVQPTLNKDSIKPTHTDELSFIPSSWTTDTTTTAARTSMPLRPEVIIKDPSKNKQTPEPEGEPEQKPTIDDIFAVPNIGNTPSARQAPTATQQKTSGIEQPIKTQPVPPKPAATIQFAPIPNAPKPADVPVVDKKPRTTIEFASDGALLSNKAIAQAVEIELARDVSDLFPPKKFLGFGQDSGLATVEWETLKGLRVEDVTLQKENVSAGKTIIEAVKIKELQNYLKNLETQSHMLITKYKDMPLETYMRNALAQVIQPSFRGGRM